MKNTAQSRRDDIFITAAEVQCNLRKKEKRIAWTSEIANEDSELASLFSLRFGIVKQEGRRRSQSRKIK
jgi:hypothetical protein